MPEPDNPGRQQSAASPCEHEYEMDEEMQMWICSRCGTSLNLVTQVNHHECGPDCDRHEDISAIG
ncbi:MAG TPA: hypothetical protein VFP63_06625 [Dehalococcoidia bacterium]|nr:hypothetical protein [Dehalococcoidia bacterium]